MSESTGKGRKDGSGRGPMLKEYAERYGADLRTVKRWKAHGVARQDELPLDDPEAMMAWWQRNMKLRVPPGITEAVVAWRKAGKSTGPVIELMPDLTLLDAPLPDRQAQIEKPVAEDEIGLEHTLRRLAETEVRLSRVATDPGQTKAWLDTVARMSSAAERLRQEHERMGKLIPRDKAETMIHEFHQPVEREIRLLYRVMCELCGIPSTTETEDRWNKECDRLFSRFKEEVFR